MVAGKVKLPTLLGIIQEVQNRPNGDVEYLGVVGSTAPVYDGDEWTTGKVNAKNCPRVASNLQDGKFDFRFTHDRKFETFKLGNERPDVTVHYPDDGLGIEVLFVWSCRSLVQFVQHLSARPLAWARRQFATVLKTYRASRVYLA